MKHTKKICALSVTAALSLALAAPAAAADYTVQRGDSLWEIAREQLGDGTRWGELYAANRDTVRDPSLIYAGQVLKIPGSGEGTAPSAPAEETMPAVESTTRTEKALALIRTFATGDTETAARLLDENYIQHNTAIADGVSGLNAALSALAQQGIQMVYDETHLVLAQGNYVLAVSEGTYGGAPTSYYDLWRVENGKIAEHWDVMETIADPSTWQNDNGKF